MNEFQTYLTLGLQHIADINAYDHMLFIMVMACAYKVKEWRKLLILVTAFTFGHSITLILAALKYVDVNMSLVEFLIPLTIFMTSLGNLMTNTSRRNDMISYLAVVFFGLIHGLGFSSYFSALLGKEVNIVWPLLSFNIGIEVGQIMIVAVFFVIMYICIYILNLKHKIWKVSVSSLGMGASLIMMFNNKFW